MPAALPTEPCPSAAAELRNRLAAAPYQAYCYSYPHKTAYRRLVEPYRLSELWADEDRSSLFLYFHIPFCESRCGYCNLFSTSDRLEQSYLDALEAQTEQVAAALGEADFARVAFGGGTPTDLAPALLERLFDLVEQRLGASLSELPSSLETSPLTALPDRLDLAAARGIDRISIGLQSLVPAELAALGRAQDPACAMTALDQIRARPFQTLNIDLIYGIPGQTVASWLHSLRAVLRWQPEELYLYPLYVRPMTGIAERCRSGSDRRLDCYRAARDLLCTEAGYQQLSMRLFRRRDAVLAAGPVYSCQEHGMVGLGCGARSYTRALHYSDEWAVSRPQVRRILESWIRRDDFGIARHGCALDADEQRRRYLIKSLLRTEGLDLSAYRRALGAPVEQHFSELELLTEAGLCLVQDQFLRLTAAGLELSDAIGPLLFSDRVRAACAGYAVR